MTRPGYLRSLLILGLVGANLLVLGLSGYSLAKSRRQYELRVQTLTHNIAGALDQSVSSSIEKIDLALRTVADELERQLAGKGIDAPAMTAFLARHETRLEEVEAIRVADAEGFVILGKGVSRAERASWADREYFTFLRDHADGGLQISKPLMGRVAKQYIVGFARRYNHPDGRFAGVISAPIAVDHFTRLLSRFDLGPKGTLILRDADLGLVTRIPPIPGQPAGQVGNSGVSSEFRQLVVSGLPSATYHVGNSPDGFERTLTFRRLERAPMFAIVGAASDDYLADWTSEVYKTSALAGGFLLLSILLGGFLLRLLDQARRREEALAERELRLRTIIDNEPECIKIVDADGRLLQMNPAGLAMLEAESADQVVGRPVLDVIAPEYRDAFLDMHRRVIGGESAQMEFEVLGFKGGRRWLETHAVPLRDGAGVAQLAITRDITERKRSDQAIRDNEKKLRHLLNDMPIGLGMIDADGLIYFRNRRVVELLGYTDADVPSDREWWPAAFPDPAYRSQVQEIWNAEVLRAVASGTDIRAREYRVTCKGGGVRDIEISGVTFGDHVLTTFMDRTEYKQDQNRLQEAMAVAETASRAKSAFLATMSHEIRTPMNGIFGMAQLLLMPRLTEEERCEYARTILDAGETLLTLLNDILDLSKVEAGKLELSRVEFDPRQSIAETAALFQELAQSKGLRIETAWRGPERSRYWFDPIRVRQMLSNLASNAIKFTSKGFVRMEAAEISRTGREALLEFSVRDSGIGVPPEKQSQLFLPFSQVDSSITREYGGTGLGLSIVRSLARLMGGDVGIESDGGEGARFWFRVRADIAPDQGAPEADPPAPNDETSLFGANVGVTPRVLVVEDNRINRKVIETLLDKLGIPADCVQNGQEAVDAVTRGMGPDLVLMDVQMPVMDGFTATELIRKWEAQTGSPRLPIIALTAGVFEEDRQRCVACGMDGFLAKPIDMDNLAVVLAQWLPGATGGK